MLARTLILTLALALFGDFAYAQAVSFEEFEESVNERTAELDKFAAVLSDPDPNRRIAAIEFMIGSDDPVLQRLAKRTGLFSPDAAVRATTLKAVFDDLPTLEIHFDAPGEVSNNYQAAFHQVRGTIRNDGTGFQVYKIEDFNEKQQCYQIGNRCFSRLTGETVSLYLNGRWASFQLNKEGLLVGEPTLGDQRVRAEVPLVE